MKNETTKTPKWLTEHNSEIARQTALRKKRALWEKSKARQDGKHHKAIAYSTPATLAEKLEVADKLISKVIRVIQSKGFTFSSFDLADMMQAGKLALVQVGFFDTGIVNKLTFRAIRNAIGSRDCMRLNCKWEFASESLTMEEIGVFHEYEQPDKLDKQTISIMRSCMATLRAAHKIDQSRRANANFKANRDFFIACVKCSTNRSDGQPLKKDTFCKRKKTFVTYLAKGAKSLAAENSKGYGKRLENEILSNLEKNLLTN